MPNGLLSAHERDELVKRLAPAFLKAHGLALLAAGFVLVDGHAAVERAAALGRHRDPTRAQIDLAA